MSILSRDNLNLNGSAPLWLQFMFQIEVEPAVSCPEHKKLLEEFEEGAVRDAFTSAIAKEESLIVPCIQAFLNGVYKPTFEECFK